MFTGGTIWILTHSQVSVPLMRRLVEDHDDAVEVVEEATNGENRPPHTGRTCGCGSE